MAARAWNLLLAAAENVARNGAGYAVAAASLFLGLTLLLSGVAISEGVKAEAHASVLAGANLYCTWDQFGRDAALPAEKVAAFAQIDGVVEAVPRIVGRVKVGEEFALLVGIPFARLAGKQLPLRGALPASGAEVLVGCELARKVGLSPGMHVGLESDSIRLFTISGVLDGTASLWSAKAIVVDLEEAQILFGESAHVSDVCLATRAGYEARVA